MIGCFFRLRKPEITRASVIINIPAIVKACGRSAGKSIQLKSAPKRGIRNFQRFRSDTLMPGLFKRIIQIEMAMAESRLSQLNEIK